MINTLSVAVMCLSFNGQVISDTKMPLEPVVTISVDRSVEIQDNSDCRVCCTISVPDAFGNMIGIMACSGGLFTSCETAGKDACKKAAEKAFDVLMDLK